MNGNKKLYLEHFFEELTSYTVQCLIFLVILLFSTDFFRNENALNKFLDDKINAHQDYLTIFFIPIFAILSVSGIIFFILRFIGDAHKHYNKVDVAPREIPKVFYLIGSSGGV